MTDFRALCEELVDNLHRYQCWYIEDNGYGLHDMEALLRRARAALAEQPVSQPYELPTTTSIPVSERLPQAEDCDAEDQCWWFSRETESQWSKWTYFRGTGAESHWLPYHSLLLPIKPEALSE